MKTYRLGEGTGPDRLVLEDGPDLAPGAHEVLMRVRATALNYRDRMIVENRYGAGIRKGVIPLSDGAGEVVAVGDKVKRAKVGDRIAGTFFADWPGGRFRAANGATQRGSHEDGMLAEFRVIAEQSFVHIPQHLSFVEAATLPCAAVTAWVALTGGRGITAGDTVLTLGTGGVALFAVQLAKALGARVVSTTSSREKAERLKALGADTVINYAETPDWDRAVREATGGEGADCVIEIGGADTLERSIRSASIGGEIALIGAASRSGTTLDMSVFAGAIVTLRRIAVGSRADFEAMNRAISVHRLRPVIDRVFPFEEAREALRYFASGTHVGKVVIEHGA